MSKKGTTYSAVIKEHKEEARDLKKDKNSMAKITLGMAGLTLVSQVYAGGNNLESTLGAKYNGVNIPSQSNYLIASNSAIKYDSKTNEAKVNMKAPKQINECNWWCQMPTAGKVILGAIVAGGIYALTKSHHHSSSTTTSSSSTTSGDSGGFGSI